jgi:hypothetical protein
MSRLDNLIYSSAVLCLSPTTEVARNKTIDTIVIQTVASKGPNAESTAEDIYNTLQKEIPIRHEEIKKSVIRCLKSDVFDILRGDIKDIRTVVFKLSSQTSSELQSERNRISEFLHEATRELFKDIYSSEKAERIENLLLECLSTLMAEYGYAYAGQLAGITDASSFVPRDVLREICRSMVEKHNIPEITYDRLMDAIGSLFDRRDPCLNNLAFCICQRYYCSRVIGLDLPVDFLSSQVYKGSIFYLDTNFMSRVALSPSKWDTEFREILQLSPKLGIKFAVCDLTIAEKFARVGEYRQLVDKGGELVPPELLAEVLELLAQTRQELAGTIREKSSFDSMEYSIDNATVQRLEEMGIEVINVKDSDWLKDEKELKILKSELAEFDERYRRYRPPKDDNALYHDAQLYHIINTIRAKTMRSTASWFLTMDNSIIAYGISKKKKDEAPYAIKIATLLHTLSPFVESQALRVEFSDLFGNLIARDLLPREQLFDVDDLKMLVGFDIKAKSIPPEIIRKGIAHIKNEVIKEGGLTEENRPQVLYEFTKYISAPDQSMVELQRRYEQKIQARDADLKREEFKTNVLQGKVKKRDYIIAVLVGVFLSILLWIGYFVLSENISEIVNRPLFVAFAIQAALVSVIVSILYPERVKTIAIVGGIATIASIVAGLA